MIGREVEEGRRRRASGPSASRFIAISHLLDLPQRDPQQDQHQARRRPAPSRCRRRSAARSASRPRHRAQSRRIDETTSSTFWPIQSVDQPADQRRLLRRAVRPHCGEDEGGREQRRGDQRIGAAMGIVGVAHALGQRRRRPRGRRGRARVCTANSALKTISERRIAARPNRQLFGPRRAAAPALLPATARQAALASGMARSR